MSSRSRRAAVLATTLLVVVIGAGPSEAQVVDPTVAIDRTGTAAGEEMLITGGGWPNGSTLIVELCGHGGLRGTPDCDVTNQRTAGVGPGGTFAVQITTALPPSPCPCVVKATDQVTQIAATAPIAVAGLPTVPITAADMPAARTIEISSIALTDGGRWAELFGAGGRRVLEVTLVNTGAVAVDSPDVSVAWGKGSHPDGFVKPPETKRMEPGDTQTLTVALNRAPFTIGQQTAIVEIQGLGEPVVARATTSGYPWGLLALALVLLQLLLLRIRNRVRRRMRRGSEHVVEAPEDAVLELPPAPAALGSGVTDEVAEDGELVVLDLVELAREGEPTAVPRNGTIHELSEPTAGPSLEVVAFEAEVEDARAVVVELQHQARIALKRAADLSEALVAASAARVEEFEAEASERLRQTAERHAEAIQLLEAARTAADELTAEATAGAAAALQEATAHREAVREAWASLDAQRLDLVDGAGQELTRLVHELEERAAALSDRPAPIRPPLDHLDRRLARALERALAPSLSDAPDAS
jgi:hypothetical protein